MPRSFPCAAGRVEGEIAPISPNAEALNLEAILAATVALGHDVAFLAGDLGLSARELAKQREHQEADDGNGAAALGRQWGFRLALLLAHVRRRYGTDRTEPLARLIAHAAGFELARAVDADGAPLEVVVPVLAAVMRETGDAVAKASAALATGGVIDPREARQLLPEIAEAELEFATLRSILERVVAAKRPA